MVAPLNLIAPNPFPPPTTALRLNEFMPSAPIVCSVSAGWRNLVVRTYRLAPGEVSLPPVPDPGIAINLSPRIDGVERSFGGAFSAATIDFDCLSYVPPNHGVAWRWGHEIEVLHIHVRRRFIQQYLERQSEFDMASLEKIDWFGFYDPLVAQIGRACIAELQACHSCPDSLYIDSLAALLAARLVHRHEPDDSKRRSRINDKSIRAAISYIRENIDKELGLLDLAHVANMSVYHFIRQFRGVAGTTPHKYVLNLRVEFAQALLRRNSLSIIEIGQKSGFSSHSHFTNTFRRHVGVTPTAYRRDNRTTIHKQN